MLDTTLEFSANNIPNFNKKTIFYLLKVTLIAVLAYLITPDIIISLLAIVLVLVVDYIKRKTYPLDVYFVNVRNDVISVSYASRWGIKKVQNIDIDTFKYEVKFNEKIIQVNFYDSDKYVGRLIEQKWDQKTLSTLLDKLKKLKEYEEHPKLQFAFE